MFRRGDVGSLETIAIGTSRTRRLPHRMPTIHLAHPATLFALCAAILPSWIGAQATVRGVVRLPVPGAVAAAGAIVDVFADTSLHGAPLRSVATDSAGRFRLQQLPRTTLAIRARRIGYAPTVQTVDLSTRDSADLALTLRDGREVIYGAAARNGAWRVAEAHAHRGEWRCTFDRHRADTLAARTYDAYVRTATDEAKKFVAPPDSAPFVRQFLRPLTHAECRRLMKGLDRHGSLTTVVLEAYRFGTGVYLPDFRSSGAIAAPDGSAMTIFVVPD